MNTAKSGELPLDSTSSASQSASQSASNSSSQREKDSVYDNDSFDETIKIRKRHDYATKMAEDAQSASQQQSASSSASSSSSPTLEELIANPVAGIRRIKRGTWTRLVLLFMMAMVLFLYWHPTAYYRAQLYFTDCVTVPGKAGYVHTVCKPLPVGHPFA